MHSFGRLIVFHDSLPESFKHTADNVIEDEYTFDVPFFRKLNEMNGPVRVVHIGDSHVRGHLYPLITRRVVWNMISVLRLFILMLFHIVPVGWHMKRANRVLFII